MGRESPRSVELVEKKGEGSFLGGGGALFRSSLCFIGMWVKHKNIIESQPRFSDAPCGPSHESQLSVSVSAGTSEAPGAALWALS